MQLRLKRCVGQCPDPSLGTTRASNEITLDLTSPHAFWLISNGVGAVSDPLPRDMRADVVVRPTKARQNRHIRPSARAKEYECVIRQNPLCRFSISQVSVSYQISNRF